MIANVYQYARWCLSTRGGYVSTAAVVCFYEKLPTNRRIREELPKWFTIEEFNGLKEVFGYFLSPKEDEAFFNEVYEVKRTRRGIPVIKTRS